jgi:exosome complex component RRP42
MSFKRGYFIENLKKEQMLELLANEKRLDERGLFEYRPLKIEVGVIDKAEGSSKVTLGNTQVIAGVKVEPDRPFPDTPDKGLMIVNAEVLPLASAYSEPGPPDEDAIELARVVDRIARESGMIEMDKLVIEPGKHVYAVFVDVNILNLDGNLFDATSYAVVSALATTKYRKYELSDGELVKTDEFVPLPITTIPVSITAARIGDIIIFDPSADEETVMEARLTVAFDGRGNLCAAQMGGNGGFTKEQILKVVEKAKLKAEEIGELLRREIERA